MGKLTGVMVAMLTLGIGSYAGDTRAGGIIEDQQPVPIRSAPVTLAGRYVLSSSVTVNPGSYILEVALLPAIQPPVHGVVVEELVVKFFQVDPATKALVLRGVHKATIELTNAQPGRKYSLRELGFGAGHAVVWHTEQGALHGQLTGNGAVIRFVLTPATR